jgi:hypothetical protein
LVLALALAGAGAICWAEARFAHGLARTHEQRAKLQDGGDDRSSALASSGLPWRRGTVGSETTRHRVTGDYWTGRYDQAAAAAHDGDAHLAFLAANAAFRSSQDARNAAEGSLARLDAVLEAYAAVLKLAPDHADASYNFEFVARLRDRLAKARKPVPAGRDAHQGARAASTAGHLPTGPTVHGRPGSTPPTRSGDEFEILTPMRFDERETQPEQSDGARPLRKG